MRHYIMRQRINKPYKGRDFTITLSKHCIREIIAQGHTFDEMILELNKSSYHSNVEFRECGQKMLRVSGIKGRLILCDERKVGITYIPDSGAKATPFRYKYDATYSSTFKLSRVFEDGDWMRLHKDGNRVTIIRNERAMGYMDMTWFTGYEYEWTTALGKVYPSEMKGKSWTLEVNNNTDRNGSRLVIKDYYDESYGKFKTKEDSDYRLSHPDKYKW